MLAGFEGDLEGGLVVLAALGFRRQLQGPALADPDFDFVEPALAAEAVEGVYALGTLATTGASAADVIIHLVREYRTAAVSAP